ncbi:DUF1127 domain-containing protein [Cochlodiniinecator piscidefendens]|uniref:DUF1127 domain-containing protein n=1 Tax=Cochlodiniinecator piscidefendens TaxID=2715756 RepID=UPI00140CEDF5|nr:DUF1127 domain-containing protein [Cochlodiniinecator piscidefendens]
MAAYENAIVSANTSFGIFATARQSIFATLTKWNEARLTRNALTSLSDRELSDIGLSRGDIEDVVSRHVL